MGEFALKHAHRFIKRIFYTYFLRDFTVCSVHLVAGSFLLVLGMLFGLYSWYVAASSGLMASTGTVMLAALPIIFGFQLLLAAVSADVANVPHQPLSRALGGRGTRPSADRVRTWLEAKARIRSRAGNQGADS